MLELYPAPAFSCDAHSALHPPTAAPSLPHSLHCSPQTSWPSHSRARARLPSAALPYLGEVHGQRDDACHVAADQHGQRQQADGQEVVHGCCGSRFAQRVSRGAGRLRGLSGGGSVMGRAGSATGSQDWLQLLGVPACKEAQPPRDGRPPEARPSPRRPLGGGASEGSVQRGRLASPRLASPVQAQGARGARALLLAGREWEERSPPARHGVCVLGGGEEAEESVGGLLRAIWGDHRWVGEDQPPVLSAPHNSPCPTPPAVAVKAKWQRLTRSPFPPSTSGTLGEERRRRIRGPPSLGPFLAFPAQF